MEFFVQKTSPIPVHKQLVEQIKIGLLLGELRPGEILPSIRDLERDLDISRNLARKAYVELEEAGIVRLIHGKGVMVEKTLRYKENKQLLQDCEELVRTTRKACQSLGVIVSSFARFLSHKAVEIEGEEPPLLYVDVSSELAKDRAEQLSHILNLNVRSWSLEDLQENLDSMPSDIKIVCNYYRLDQVKEILGRRDFGVIPLRMGLSQHVIERLRRLPKGSRIMFIFHQKDKSGLDLILTDYNKMFSAQQLEFVARFVKDSKRGIDQLINEDGFARIMISNRMWNDVPAEVRKLQRVMRPSMDFDHSSIEESKIQLGVIG